MAITGKTDRLYPDFYNRLSKWNAACGNVYYVKYGVRSYEEQKRLYDLYISGQRSIIAAEPGPTAKHMYGLAADLENFNGQDPTYAHRKLAESYGLTFNVASEPWHVVHADFRSLIDSGTVKPVYDTQTATSYTATKQGLRLLKPNMSGGPEGKALKLWLKSNFATYASKVGTSDDWIGGKGSDSWNAMQEFARRTGLLSATETLDTWGPKCWTKAKEYGFKF